MSSGGSSGEDIGWEIFKYLLPKAQMAFFCVLQFLIQWTSTRLYSTSGFLVLSSTVLTFLLLAHAFKVKTTTLLRLIIIVSVSLVFLSVATCFTGLFLLAISLVTLAGALQDFHGPFLELFTEATPVLRELREELTRSDLYEFVVNGVAVLKPTSTFLSADEVFSEPFPNKCVADEFSSRFWCTAHHIFEPLGQGILVSKLERASENFMGLANRLHEVVLSGTARSTIYIDDAMPLPTLNTSTGQGTLESFEPTRIFDSLFRKSFSLVDYGSVFAIVFLIFLVAGFVTMRRRIATIPRILSESKPTPICPTDKLPVVGEVAESCGHIEQLWTSIAEDCPSDSSYTTALLVHASGCDLSLPTENSPAGILQNVSDDVQTLCIEAKDITENLALQSELPSTPDGSEDRPSPPNTIIIDSAQSTTDDDVSTLDASDNALATIAEKVAVEDENLPSSTTCQTGLYSANCDETHCLCTDITNMFNRLKTYQQLQQLEIDSRLFPLFDSQWEISSADLSIMLRSQLMYDKIVKSSMEILGEETPSNVDGQRKRIRERNMAAIDCCSDKEIQAILLRIRFQLDEVENLSGKRHEMKECCLSIFRGHYKDFSSDLTVENEKITILRRGETCVAGPKRDVQHDHKPSPSYCSSSVHSRGDTSPGPTAVDRRQDEASPSELAKDYNHERKPAPKTPETLDSRVRQSISNVKSGTSRRKPLEDIDQSCPTAVTSQGTAVDVVERLNIRIRRRFQRRADYIVKLLEEMKRRHNCLLSVDESALDPAKETNGGDSHEFISHRRDLSDGSALVNLAQPSYSRRRWTGVRDGLGDPTGAENAVNPRSVSEPVGYQHRVSDKCNDEESRTGFRTRAIDDKRVNGSIRETHRRAVSDYGRNAISNQRSRRYTTSSAERASVVDVRRVGGLASEGTNLTSQYSRDELNDDQNRENASFDSPTRQTTGLGATYSKTKTGGESSQQMTGARFRGRHHRTTSARRTTACSSGQHEYDITEEQSDTSIVATHVEKRPQAVCDSSFDIKARYLSHEIGPRYFTEFERCIFGPGGQFGPAE